MNNFFKSIHCKSNAHCTMCRSQNAGGIFWRTQMRKTFDDILEVDFKCPQGKNWGDTGIEWPSNDIYSDELRFRGDSWTFICWLLQQSESGEIPKVTSNSRFEEIVELIDSKGKIEFLDQKGGKITEAYWTIKCLPTKTRWKPGKYKRICYQFNTDSIYKPPRWELLEFLNKFKEYELIKLGKNRPIEEWINIASTCDAFVGVSGDAAHVMHSVGIPTFIVSDVDIRHLHGQNEYVLCENLLDCETKIGKYLIDGVYEPKIHLADPPVNIISCGCLPEIWAQLKDLSGSIKDISKFLTEPLVTPADYVRRKKICQQCSSIDSTGARLFRKFNGNYYSCGALRLVNILRNSKIDGCGCILNLKWAGLGQKCIKGFW